MYIWDLENTITNSNHRAHHAEKREWDQFHSLFPQDIPRWNNIALLRTCARVGQIYILTGMPERHRQMAFDWLEKYNIVVDQIYMRADDDFRPSPKFKVDTIQKLRIKPWMVFDDRADIVIAMLEANIPAIHLGKD